MTNDERAARIEPKESQIHNSIARIRFALPEEQANWGRRIRQASEPQRSRLAKRQFGETPRRGEREEAEKAEIARALKRWAIFRLSFETNPVTQLVNSRKASRLIPRRLGGCFRVNLRQCLNYHSGITVVCALQQLDQCRNGRFGGGV